MLAVALVPTACVLQEQANAVDDQVERYLAARRERLVAARADFAKRRPLPHVVRGADGTIVIERAELVGAIDQEFLRLRVCYVNETDRTFDRVRASFVVKDGFGRVRGQHDVDFVMPLAYRFTPNSSYTDEVHVPTGGAHEVPGFDLFVETKAETW